MLKILKTLARAMIPDRLVALREKMALDQVPQKSLDHTSLRRLPQIDLKEAFTDPNIIAAWEHDVAKISQVFPFRDIYGGICPGERRAIYHLIARWKPKRVLEIGTHIGASTLVIAQALETHSGNDSLLTTGDILDVNSSAEGAAFGLGMPPPADNLRRLGLSHRVRFEKKSAFELMNQLEEKMDLIFLDGDHAGSAVYGEISAALSHLSENGVILLHDFYPDGAKIFPIGTIIHGPSIAADRIRREAPDIRITPFGRLPWETKQGVKTATLAFVSRT